MSPQGKDFSSFYWSAIVFSTVHKASSWQLRNAANILLERFIEALLLRMRMSQISCFLFSIPKSLLFPQGCLLTLACLISLYNMNCLISTFSNNFDSSSKFLNCVRLCFIRAPTSYFCLLQFKPEIRTCSILVLGSSFSMELILKVCSKPNQIQPFFYPLYSYTCLAFFTLTKTTFGICKLCDNSTTLTRQFHTTQTATWKSKHGRKWLAYICICVHILFCSNTHGLSMCFVPSLLQLHIKSCNKRDCFI